jgi:hypothetical protein
VMVSHSEVILDEALDNNLTLLMEGRADDLARKTDIRNSLKHFGAEHYIKARERGYVLYVEGGTDVDMLRALAERLGHPVASDWDERINSFYVQNNYPDKSLDSELERVEGGFGITPRDHFKGLCNLLPQLKGLAVLDNDGRDRQGALEGNLQLTYWRRYEAENYFVTPDVLRRYALDHFADLQLFGGHQVEIDEVLDALLLEQVFEGAQADFDAWKQSPAEVVRIVWEAKTQRTKLSTLAEEFFRRLSARVGGSMLLKKGELHRLVSVVDANAIPAEVAEKLDFLHALFKSAVQSADVPDAASNGHNGK